MTREDVINRLRRKCIAVRRDIVEMIYTAGSGHPGGSLSSVEILTALYFDIMNVRLRFLQQALQRPSGFC